MLTCGVVERCVRVRVRVRVRVKMLRLARVGGGKRFLKWCKKARRRVHRNFAFFCGRFLIATG